MSVSGLNLARTAQHWSQEGAWKAGRGLFWLELASVQRRLNHKVSGRPDIDWVHCTLERYFAGRLPLEHCLSLGCGEGGLERQLAGLGVFETCDAYDIADGSILKAQEAAQAAGYNHIHYAVRDLNRIALPAQYYDAVWASGAVHHLERLEHVFTQVAQSLKPGGLFILNEYIGPTRFQFPPCQRQIIQACHELLPLEYRRLSAAALERDPVSQGRQELLGLARRIIDKLRDGDLRGAIWRWAQRKLGARSGTRPIKTATNLPTARSVAAIDPSEAVRSAEIVPLLCHYFDVIELKPLGGSILQFLLADIAGNFQDKIGEQLLNMLFVIEDALMASGDLESDFAYIVAAPRALSGKPTEEMP